MSLPSRDCGEERTRIFTEALLNERYGKRASIRGENGTDLSNLKYFLKLHVRLDLDCDLCVYTDRLVLRTSSAATTGKEGRTCTSRETDDEIELGLGILCL